MAWHLPQLPLKEAYCLVLLPALGQVDSSPCFAPPHHTLLLAFLRHHSLPTRLTCLGLPALPC